MDTNEYVVVALFRPKQLVKFLGPGECSSWKQKLMELGIVFYTVLFIYKECIKFCSSKHNRNQNQKKQCFSWQLRAYLSNRPKSSLLLFSRLTGSCLAFMFFCPLPLSALSLCVFNTHTPILSQKLLVEFTSTFCLRWGFMHTLMLTNAWIHTYQSQAWSTLQSEVNLKLLTSA